MLRECIKITEQESIKCSRKSQHSMLPLSQGTSRKVYVPSVSLPYQNCTDWLRNMSVRLGKCHTRKLMADPLLTKHTVWDWAAYVWVQDFYVLMVDEKLQRPPVVLSQLEIWGPFPWVGQARGSGDAHSSLLYTIPFWMQHTCSCVPQHCSFPTAWQEQLLCFEWVVAFVVHHHGDKKPSYPYNPVPV